MQAARPARVRFAPQRIQTPALRRRRRLARAASRAVAPQWAQVVRPGRARAGQRTQPPTATRFGRARRTLSTQRRQRRESSRAGRALHSVQRGRLRSVTTPSPNRPEYCDGREHPQLPPRASSSRLNEPIGALSRNTDWLGKGGLPTTRPRRLGTPLPGYHGPSSGAAWANPAAGLINDNYFPVADDAIGRFVDPPRVVSNCPFSLWRAGWSRQGAAVRTGRCRRRVCRAVRNGRRRPRAPCRDGVLGAWFCGVWRRFRLQHPFPHYLRERTISGSANTKRLFPALGRISGVSPMNPEAVPAVPVLTATYCRPSTA